MKSYPLRLSLGLSITDDIQSLPTANSQQMPVHVIPASIGERMNCGAACRCPAVLDLCIERRESGDDL